MASGSRMFPIHLSPLTAIHLSPSVAGCVRLYVCLQFICFPLQPFICLPVWLVVSALWMSPIHLSPLIAIHLSPRFAGSVRLSGCLHLICLPLKLKSSVSHCGWWRPAHRMSPIDLSPSLAGGVRLSGCLQLICLPFKAIHLSPSLAGGVRLSICLPL